tara:strand:+ start:15 stop:1202 length:1188 start_codon:yes stop_codon:yes gene_type:complete
MEVRITKPEDGGGYYSTEITCGTFNFPARRSVDYNRKAKDPVQSGLESFWRMILSNRRKKRPRSYGRYNGNTFNFGDRFNHVVMINKCPVVISREGIRYHLNGKSYSLSTICSALARLTYKSCFEDNPEVLLSSLYTTLNLPENVKYCLENRAPFHFIENYQKVEVRLNVMQIGDKTMAMEISDGIWGELSVKELDTYCNYYVHGKTRGSWKRLAPKTLYERLMGKSPSESELKVMVAFLKQNRMSDIVEERALQLVSEMVESNKGRLVAHYNDDNVLEYMLIRGKDYDWKLTNNKFKSGIQMVSTFVWQPIKEKKEIGVDEEGKKIYEVIYTEPKWRGPICIDNMSDGSPLGDQFATRALALLNDSMTIKIVNTIKSYIAAKPNEYRVDENDLR